MWRFALANVALTRLYTVLPLALLAYGVGIAAGGRSAHVLASAAAIAAAVAGGYAYNDLRDQQLDRCNRPGRPLVSGRLSERYVRYLIAGLWGVSALLAIFTLSWRTMAFTFLLIASSCLYSDALKYVPGVKNLFVGAWCGALPWGASLDAVHVATALPAIAIVAMFILQKELLADAYDLDGDVAAGLRTIPAIYGRRVTLAIVALLNVVSWILLRVLEADGVIVHLAVAAEGVATLNVLAVVAVLCRINSFTLRAYLELQKIFLIGGCLGLFALLGR